jgi:outer membrane protein TolC
LFRNFGRLAHREPIVQADSDLRRARRRLELQKADLVVQVVGTYEEILRLERQVRSDQASFERMDALHRVTEAKAVLGRTTRIDTLRVELLRGEALVRLENSRERLDSTQRDFAELLGFSPDTVFELAPPDLLEIDIPESEQAVRTALENRLDYAQVLQDAEDAGRRLRINRRRLLPDLTLIGGHERFGEGPNSSDATRLDDSIWFVGISAGTDLNLTRERVAIEQAGLNHSAALQTVDIVALSIARQVQQELLAYRRAQGELKIAERNLELAASRATVAQRFFDMGRGDNFAVTDAEEALQLAENRSFSARAEASTSGYRLFRVLGTLIESPADLKPGLGRRPA